MTQQNVNNPIPEQDALGDKGANLISLVAIVAVVAVVALLYILAQLFNPNTAGVLTAAQAQEQVVERLRPVAGFEMGATSKGPKTGEEVYNGLCQACHAAGVAGAPKVGDNAAWGARIAQGFATLVKHANEGYTGASGVMPAKGGNPALSDLEIERAIVFMTGKSGGSFPEPAAPAADAKAADGNAASAAPAKK